MKHYSFREIKHCYLATTEALLEINVQTEVVYPETNRILLYCTHNGNESTITMHADNQNLLFASVEDAALNKPIELLNDYDGYVLYGDTSLCIEYKDNKPILKGYVFEDNHSVQKEFDVETFKWTSDSVRPLVSIKEKNIRIYRTLKECDAYNEFVVKDDNGVVSHKGGSMVPLVSYTAEQKKAIDKVINALNDLTNIGVIAYLNREDEEINFICGNGKVTDSDYGDFEETDEIIDIIDNPLIKNYSFKNVADEYPIYMPSK